MKKVLIVSPYFAPENSVASIRFTKIAKYLQRMGYDVTVLCTQMNVQWVVDKTLEEDLKELKKVVRIRYPEFLYYKVKERLGTESAQIRPAKDGQTKEAENSKWKDSLIWGYAHVCSVLLGKRFIKYVRQQGQSYDVVITTFNPISGHVLGNYMKKHKLCTTWIEDFRDPMTLLCDKSFLAFLTQMHGASLMRRSDYITTVSKGFAKSLVREAGQFGVDIRKKLRVISNGYDSADREALAGFVPEKDKLIFAYCGTIYKIGGQIKNDISPLFAALANLVRQGKIERDRVEIQYAGNDGDVFDSFAEKYSLDGIVRRHGRVSRDESLKLQRSSDIIIVPVWNNRGENGIISGKFFETLLVQRNVLCIVTGNQTGSELSSMIGKIRCGFSYEEINGDKSGQESLEAWILERYQEKIEHGALAYCSSNEDQKYSHQYLARKFEKLF